MLSCKHENLFGKPGIGIHRIHFGGVALVDFVLRNQNQRNPIPPEGK